MKLLQQKIIRAHAALRLARARLAWTNPARSRPARLVVRLDDVDLPGSVGEGNTLTRADWRRILVDGVAWLGPLPVTVIAGNRGDHPELIEILRFAHRLECPTLLVCDGGGIDVPRALELMDIGLESVRIRVGGVSEAVHHSVVGGSVSVASDALTAFVDARKYRGVPIDIEVLMPWKGQASTEVRAVLGWARQVGSDGFRLTPPWRAEDLPADPEVLDDIGETPGPFNRTNHAAVVALHAMVAEQDGEPGRRRQQGKCPVGGQRLEITENGQLYSCPFHPPIAMKTALKDSWEDGGRAHLKAIAGCSRSCHHTELAPAFTG